MIGSVRGSVRLRFHTFANRMRLNGLVVAFSFLWLTQIVHTRRYMKMFTDAGVRIQCPSGNKVYIHPITGDLQLCKQQLGVYNETSCPGGTACERFPILIPGFQDYCCWSESNPETVSAEILPPMSKRKPAVTVNPIDEQEEEEDEEENENSAQTTPKQKLIRKSLKEIIEEVKSEEEEEDDDEEIDWHPTTTTKKPFIPRSRKPMTTTTTTTTTTSPFIESSPAPTSRLPQCNNPDETVLIDYGNRLRDCYFQQCHRGFKCEFNREIRRFICCGRAIEVPPAGLPPIPAPRPLIPRPFRPNRPFNDGDGDENEKLAKPPIKRFKKLKRKGPRNGDDDDDCYCNNNECSCPDYSYENRENRRGNRKSSECWKQCRRNKGIDCDRECECDGSKCSRKSYRKVPKSKPIKPIEDEMGECEYPSGPLPPIPDPKPICAKFRKREKGRTGEKRRHGSNRPPSRPSRPSDRPSMRSRKIIKSGRKPRPLPPPSRIIRPDDEKNEQPQFPIVQPNNNQNNQNLCKNGDEFLDGMTAPKCIPPAIDSCPLTHKRCIMSDKYQYHVCCRNNE